MKFVNDYRQCCYDFYEKRVLQAQCAILHQDVFDDFLAQKGRYASFYPMLTMLTQPSQVSPLEVLHFAEESNIITAAMLEYVIHHPGFNKEVACALFDVIENIPSANWSTLPDEVRLVVQLCYVRYAYHKKGRETANVILEWKGAVDPKQWEYWVNVLELNQVNMFHPEGLLTNVCCTNLSLPRYPSDLDNPFYPFMPPHIQLYRQYHTGELSLSDAIGKISTDNALKSFYKKNIFLEELLNDVLLTHDYGSINQLVSKMLYFEYTVESFKPWFRQQSKEVQYYFIAMPKIPQGWEPLWGDLGVSDMDKSNAGAKKKSYRDMVEMLEPDRVNGTSISRYWLKDLEGSHTINEEPLYLT